MVKGKKIAGTGNNHRLLILYFGLHDFWYWGRPQARHGSPLWWTVASRARRPGGGAYEAASAQGAAPPRTAHGKCPNSRAGPGGPARVRRPAPQWWEADDTIDSEMGAGALARRILPLLAFIIFGGLSCAPPTAIATFAGDADKAITAGTPIFADIHESCVRRQAEEQPLTPQYPHAGQTQTAAGDETVCASFASEVQELESVSSILSAYFRAMQQLARFDQTNVSTQAEHAGANIGTAAILSLNQTDAVAKLSGLITRALTGHYQRSKLGEFLRTADPHVTAVSQALETVLTKDYGSLLDEEERATKRRYGEVSRATEPATVLLLNRAYLEDLHEVQRRRAAAKAYAEVLRQAREGHHLLASTGHLNNKELSLALQPYVSKLQAFAPSIQTQP